MQLPDGPRRRLDSLIALICDFDREITQTTREIDQRAKADERVKLLCQIRGIGPYTAMLIIAEVGEVKRFPTAKHLCQWAGLTPTVRSSDGKARLGHISRQGSTILRWALCEAAQHTPTGGGPLRAQYERIAKRRGSKIAKSRGRPPNPHPLLLRAQRRRDPLPDPSTRPTSTTSWPTPHDTRQPPPSLRSTNGREVHARASSLLCLVSSTPVNRTAAGLD